MHTLRSIVIVTLLLLCVLTIASVQLTGKETEVTAETGAQTAMVQASQKAYESTLAAYRAGDADIEDVYTWSKRWMNADHKSSRVDHLTRMVELHQHVAKLHREDRRGGEATRYYATLYYVAEAQALRNSP